MKEFCTVIIDYIKKPDTWVAIATIATSLFALFQTKKQIRISNKQNLLNRRIEQYLFATELFNLYEQSQEYFQHSLFYSRMIGVPLKFLTNSDKLSALQTYVRKFDFVKDNKDNDKYRQEYIKTLGYLKASAEEISIIWNDENSKIIYQFIMLYYELLNKMIDQELYIRILKYENENNETSVLNDVESQKKINEKIKQFAEKKKFDKINQQLEDTYKIIKEKNVLQNLKESIKLN